MYFMGTASNMLKTAILLALLTALLLWVGQTLGGTYGLVFAAFFVILMNGVSYWFSDKIVLKMYKAEELPRTHEVTRMVKELSNKMDLPMPQVYMVPDRNPNAFATGRSPKKAAVAVTQGLLELLNERELKGVLAHEMSHIKNRDTLISTVAGMIAGVIGFVASMAQWAAIFGFGGRDERGGLVQLLVIAIITPIIATIIQLAVSRTREYAADETAARVLMDGSGLRSALLKLESGVKKNPLRVDGRSQATEHMFIMNPFAAKSWTEIFSTHPTTQKRVERLESIQF